MRQCVQLIRGMAFQFEIAEQREERSLPYFPASVRGPQKPLPVTLPTVERKER